MENFIKKQICEMMFDENNHFAVFIAKRNDKEKKFELLTLTKGDSRLIKILITKALEQGVPELKRELKDILPDIVTVTQNN